MGPRRKKDVAWLEIIPQAVGLLFLLCFISPSFRQALFSLGSLVLLAVVIFLIGLGGLVLYRKKQSKSSSTLHFDFPNIADILPSPARPLANEIQSSTDLIARLRKIDWFQFEKIVGILYRKLGYKVIHTGGANPDGGIDMIIEKNGTSSGVQCKQWKSWNVGVKPIREFLGALTDAGIRPGIFITLNGYTGEAKQLAEKHGIQILNEADLAELLEQTDARFDPECLEILNDSRKFCPKCKSEMVLRTATKGVNPGQQFWGCSAYPKCRFTLPCS